MNLQYYELLREAVETQMSYYQSAVDLEVHNRKRTFKMVFEGLDNLCNALPIEHSVKLRSLLVMWRSMESEYQNSIRGRNAVMQTARENIQKIMDDFIDISERTDLNVKPHQSN